jgi:nitrogen-specific signal transduction histidine kinase
MLDEDRWPDFWTDYCAALGGKFLIADNAPYVLGVAVLPSRSGFSDGRSITIVAHGMNDRSGDDAKDSFLDFVTGLLLNALQSAQNYCGVELTLSPDDTVDFLVFNAKALTPSTALKQIMQREGGRLTFFGEQRFRGALARHAPLSDRFGVTQADEIKRLREQNAALRHKKQQLQEQLELYRNEYRVFGDRKARQSAVDAWRSMLGETQHRLGTLIANIKLNADLTAKRLSEAGVDGSLVSDLHTIEDLCIDATRRLNRLELRGLTRRPSLTTLKVHELTKDLRTVCGELHISSDLIRIDRSVRESDAEIALDIEGWKDVIRELVENSRYWMATKPTSNQRISIIASMHFMGGDQIPDFQLEFSDDGPGIPDDTKHDVFLPTISKRPGGIGTGLAVVQKFFDDHNGEIREVGEFGMGARFVMRVPTKAQT